jgi:hypothetical protein
LSAAQHGAHCLFVGALSVDLLCFLGFSGGHYSAHHTTARTMLKLKIYDIGETQRSRKIDANCNGLHCIAFESSLWPKEDKQLTDGVQETFLDEEESEAQEAEARDAIVMED